MLQKFVKDNFPTVNIPLEECEKADFILGDTFYPEIERFNGCSSEGIEKSCP